MRTAFLITTLFVIAAALAWELVPMQVTVWDGGFDLTVNASSTVGPLRSIRCKPCIQREEAEWVLENPLHPEARGCSTEADPFDGKSLTVYVPITGRDSPSGRELWRRQYQYLV